LGGIIELVPTASPSAWTFEVPPTLCAGTPERPFLFGGSGLAACVAAILRTERAPLTWITGQYVAYAWPGERLTIEIADAARGRNTVQLQVTARVEDRVVVTAQAACGERPGAGSRQLTAFGDPPPPDACPTVLHAAGNPGGVNGRFEFRLISGRFPAKGVVFETPGDGRLSLWVRPRAGWAVEPCLLAIVADYVSEALSDAAGRRVHASSIDNTLRLGPIERSEWLRCDIAIEAVHAGVGHGRMRIHSQSGLLMALASTSLILREPRSPAAQAT